MQQLKDQHAATKVEDSMWPNQDQLQPNKLFFKLPEDWYVFKKMPPEPALFTPSLSLLLLQCKVLELDSLGFQF